MSQTEVQNFLHQEKQITRKIPSASVLKYLEICLKGLQRSHFGEVTELLSRVYTLLKKSVLTFLTGCSKNGCFTSFRKFPGKQTKQFELSNLPPITILKTDYITNVSEHFLNCWERKRL